MKPLNKNYYCKYCKTTETIPEKEYGKEITGVQCPKCLAKGKRAGECKKWELKHG